MNNSRKSYEKPKRNKEIKGFCESGTRQPKLLDQIRNRIRYKHYSIRTEQAYIEWIRNGVCLCLIKFEQGSKADLTLSIQIISFQLFRTVITSAFLSTIFLFLSI